VNCKDQEAKSCTDWQGKQNGYILQNELRSVPDASGTSK
jgi:hypothetical protein